MKSSLLKFILCDIEGTTSSISFVHDVLFPYSYDRLEKFILENSAREEIKKILGDFIEADPRMTVNSIVAELKKYVREDRKHPGLKAIQGMIWKIGFESGALEGHLYQDAFDCLKKWQKQGLILGIYSSGSVEAQKLLFKHSQFGDLSPLFSCYFDTGVGAKKEGPSYEKIFHELRAKNTVATSSEILFLSDVEEELNAARAAGFQTGLLDRDNKIKKSVFAKYQDFHSIPV